MNILKPKQIIQLDYKNKYCGIIDKIQLLENEIKDLKKEKIKIELLLWDNCEHVWRRDPSACFDDIHKYFCSKFNLNKERSLYVCH